MKTWHKVLIGGAVVVPSVSRDLQYKRCQQGVWWTVQTAKLPNRIPWFPSSRFRRSQADGPIQNISAQGYGRITQYLSKKATT